MPASAASASVAALLDAPAPSLRVNTPAKSAPTSAAGESFKDHLDRKAASPKKESDAASGAARAKPAEKSVKHAKAGKAAKAKAKGKADDAEAEDQAAAKADDAPDTLVTVDAQKAGDGEQEAAAADDTADPKAQAQDDAEGVDPTAAIAGTAVAQAQAAKNSPKDTGAGKDVPAATVGRDARVETAFVKAGHAPGENAKSADAPAAGKPNGKQVRTVRDDQGVEPHADALTGEKAGGATTKPPVARPGGTDVAKAREVNAAAPKDEAAPTGDDSGAASPVDTLLPNTLQDLASLHAAPSTTHAAPASPQITTQAAPPPPPEVRFAEANHTNIVNDVRTQLLPGGGSMKIRLDPPELGALQVSAEMRDGTLNVTFQTSNDDATRLLSHSLSQLKTALESQGVNVDRIQVQQSPKDQQASNQNGQSQQQEQSRQNQQEAQREQQRREMLERMWRRVSGVPDPVDLVA